MFQIPGFVVATPSVEGMQLLEEITEKFGGMKRSSTDSISTPIVRYPPGIGVVKIAAITPHMKKKLGRHGGTYAVYVEDPTASAKAAAQMLRARGYKSAKAIYDPLPNLPEGMRISMVKCRAAFGETVVQFEKKTETQKSPMPLPYSS